MKTNLILITVIGMLFLNINNVKAQIDTTKITPSHMQAAERMIQASGLEENTRKMFDQIIIVQSRQLPENKRAAFKDVMNRFINEYVSGEKLKKAFMPIYASEFSEDELNKIADFLSSPAGKTLTAKQPELFQKGAAWGMQLVKDHQLELEQMMKDAMPAKK
jgi:hypothetical protein